MGTETKSMKVDRNVYTCDRCGDTTPIMWTTHQAMVPKFAEVERDDSPEERDSLKWTGDLCERCAEMNHHRIQTPIVRKKGTKKGEKAAADEAAASRAREDAKAVAG